MKKKLLSLLLLGGLTLTAGAQNFHPFDGTFETWQNCNPWEKGQFVSSSYGREPINWCVSNVPNNLAPKVAEQVDAVNGSGVKLTNKNLTLFSISQDIPAYITLGTAWATAETTWSSVRSADGGSFGGINFTYHPDAVRFNYKRDASQGTERATIVAYTWNGNWTQADVPSNTATGTWSTFGSATKVEMTDRERCILDNLSTSSLGGDVTCNGNLVAKTIDYITDNNSSTWGTKVVEFDYGSNKNVYGIVVEKLNIIISCNDYFADRSTIVANNTLTIDNVELLYYHGLESITYDGNTRSFATYEDVNTVSVDFSDVEYNFANPITYVRKGQGATVSVGAYDEEKAQITISVLAEDYDETLRPNQYTNYVLQFKKADEPEAIVTNYTNALTVSVNGQTTAPQSETIQLIEETDGTFTFVLKNFVLRADGGNMPIGNIRLTNIAKNGNNISTLQNAEITEGDDPAYEGQWFGPSLTAMGDIPVELLATIESETSLLAEIDIDLMSMMGQVINVVFAPAETYTDGNALSLNTGLKNIVLNRSFPAGWNTICLPFVTTPSAFSWADAGGNAVNVNVQRFSSVDNNTLSFSAVGATDEMEANTPYLIFFPQEKSSATYFGTTVVDNTPIDVTDGDFTFKGNYVANMPMADLYGVADKDGVQKIMKGSATAKLQGTRAYFAYSGTSSVSGMRLNLEGQDDVTSIDGVEVMNGSFDIYNLQGIRVRTAATSLEGLGRGVYVVNGKKVMVK